WQIFSLPAKQSTCPCALNFIESTAPNNIDDGPAPPAPLDEPLLQLIPADAAVAEIADILANAESPNLVIMVHGFNNPETDALRLYEAAARAVAGDAKIPKDDGLVCVGYRWPSEKMGQPWPSTRTALPLMPIWIWWTGVALLGSSLAWYWLAWSS